MIKTFQIQTDQGVRLDQWLSQKFPEESRNYWQKKVKNKEILVNNKKSKSHYILKIGDEVTLKLETQSSTLTGEKIPLDIVFEDENYAIINKPAGLVVHPGAGHKDHTLVHGLIYHFGKSLSESSGSNRPGIVHRLDKETSGLLVIAKNNQTHRNLSQQFEAKTVKKTYQALIEGTLQPEKGSIEAPLNRSKINRQKISISTRKGSRYALTHYEVKKYFQSPFKASLLQVRIETGRTHQIRVHFESIGHPVIADQTYGHPKTNKISDTLGLKRQFLHATELKFISPTTQKQVHYKSPLSPDLADFLENLS